MFYKARPTQDGSTLVAHSIFATDSLVIITVKCRTPPNGNPGESKPTLHFRTECRQSFRTLFKVCLWPRLSQKAPVGPTHFFSNSRATGKIIFSHSAYALADGCKPSFATSDRSSPIFLLSGKISTTDKPRFFASSVTI